MLCCGDMPRYHRHMNATGNRLLIRPASADPASADLVIDSAIDWLWLQEPEQTSSKQGTRPPASSAATLLIPASWMHIRTLQLPTMGAAKLAQALPYALEDFLAGDVEQLHVVSCRQQQDGSVLVAAMDPELLQAVLAQLQALDISVQRAVPDALCLPHHADGHSIMPMADGWLLRDHNDEALFLRAEELEWLDGAADKRSEWHWYGRSDQQPPAAIKGHLQQHRVNDLLHTLGQQAGSCELNLLRGRFAVNDRSSGQLWRAPALAAALLLVLLSGYAISEQLLLQRELSRQQQRVQQQMQRAFPAITTIVNPRVQAERALAARSGGGSDQLLSLLQATAPVLAAQQLTSLQSLEYSNAQLRLQLRTASVTRLDDMLLQLRRQGLLARLEGVTSDADSVRAAVIVSAGGA